MEFCREASKNTSEKIIQAVISANLLKLQSERQIFSCRNKDRNDSYV